MTDTTTRTTRWLIRRDMEEVNAIERRSFADPWNNDDFLLCLKQRNVIGCVSELEAGVDGFMLYALHKNHLEILRLAVHPESRRCGVGRHMMDRLKSKLEQQKRGSLHIEVAEENLAGQLFLRQCGFRATQIKGQSYLFKWILGVSE